MPITRRSLIAILASLAVGFSLVPHLARAQSLSESASTGLTITVQDASGAPISKAFVRVQHWSFSKDADGPRLIEDATGRSDAEGKFSTRVREGSYDVFVSAPAFMPAAGKVDVHEGHEAHHDFHLALYSSSGLEWHANK
jgi:hypothetical protein